MNFRNRALLDLAYEIDCTAQIHAVCEGGRGEPAHSNQSRHGKGAGIKAHDHFFASMCRSCHREIDQGKHMSREERFEVWNRAHERTFTEFWKRGFLCVRK